MNLKEKYHELSIGLKKMTIFVSESGEKCCAFSEAKSWFGKEGILSSKQ